MSLSITLYQHCVFTNKYFKVSKSTGSLITYLQNLPHITVYSGDDIYYTNSGTISIDNTNLISHTADQYNYMVFTNVDDNGVSSYRYAFVNNITLVNSVAIIEYEEDIWSNYAIELLTHKIRLSNSLLGQAKTLNGGTGYEYTATEISSLPRRLPIELEGQNAPEFLADQYPNEYNRYGYVLLTASLYKLTAQGEVNQRWISNYLLSWKQKTTGGITPNITTKEYLWRIDNDLLNIIADIQARSSDEVVRNTIIDDPNWHYEIIDIKLIPEDIGDTFFTSVLNADSTHDAGLHPDFTLPVLMVGLTNNNNYAQFDTDVDFNNLVLSESGKYISGGITKYTFNGLDLNSRIQYTKTIQSDKKFIAFGNLSRIIPLTFNGLTKKAVIELNINQYDNKIQLLFDNTITDISSDFTLTLPLSVQSADITQQQKIALKTGNMVAMIGMTQQAIQTGLSMASSYVGGMKGISNASTMAELNYAGESAGINIAGAGSSGILGLISSGVQLDSRNSSQYITNKIINVDETAVINCIIGGLREIEMNYDNTTLVDKMISIYGYKYQLLINSFDTVYASNNYIKFIQANVFGDFSQDIARKLEAILESGIILV